jgi:hypothetical protein
MPQIDKWSTTNRNGTSINATRVIFETTDHSNTYQKWKNNLMSLNCICVIISLSTAIEYKVASNRTGSSFHLKAETFLKGMFSFKIKKLSNYMILEFMH